MTIQKTVRISMSLTELQLLELVKPLFEAQLPELKTIKYVLKSSSTYAPTKVTFSVTYTTNEEIGDL